MWALTCFFNPARYAARLRNYQIFRRNLQLPLLTVELSFDGAFELQNGDAEILVQRRSSSIMWQKERLLNIGLGHLPATDKVVFLDCDLIAPAPTWADETSRLLEAHLVVQPFERAYHLQPQARDLSAGHLFSQPSLAALAAAGTPAAALINSSSKRTEGVHTAGFAWAMRTEFVKRHRLYDCSIVGGGDSAFAAAVYGCFDNVTALHAMNARQTSRYRAWAEPVFAAVGGAVGCTAASLLHLWHGAMDARQPRKRHRELAAFGFDPATDLRLSKAGVWEWGSDKPELHSYLRGYFNQRREDDLR